MYRRRLLRQDGWWVKRGTCNKRPDLNARCDGRNRRQRRPALMGTAFWTTVVAVKKVIAHPERVKARLFSSERDRLQLWPAHHALYLWQLDANPQWKSGHCNAGCGRCWVATAAVERTRLASGEGIAHHLRAPRIYRPQRSPCHAPSRSLTSP